MENNTFMTDGKYTVLGSYPKFGKAEFEITLLDGAYRGKLIAGYGGNVYGSTLIKAVTELFEDDEFEPKMKFPENQTHAVVDEDGFLSAVHLYDDTGDELVLTDWQDIRHSIVGVMMIDYKVE